jgi:hypothetical protein
MFDSFSLSYRRYSVRKFLQTSFILSFSIHPTGYSVYPGKVLRFKSAPEMNPSRERGGKISRTHSLPFVSMARNVADVAASLASTSLTLQTSSFTCITLGPSFTKMSGCMSFDVFQVVGMLSFGLQFGFLNPIRPFLPILPQSMSLFQIILLGTLMHRPALFNQNYYGMPLPSSFASSVHKSRYSSDSPDPLYWMRGLASNSRTLMELGIRPYRRLWNDHATSCRR